MYLYGIDFELLTDHEPLQYIYSATSKSSARISRWVLCLLPYKFKVIYIRGKNNVADSLSRLMKMNEKGVQQTDTEDFVKFVTLNAVPKAMSVSEIEHESANDSVLKRVRGNIRTGKWTKGERTKHFK